MIKEGDFPAAEAALQEGLEQARLGSEPLLVADFLNRLGNVAYFQGRFRQALLLYDDAVALRREAAAHHSLAHGLGNQGNALVGLGRYDRAVVVYEEALSIYRELREAAELGSDARAELDQDVIDATNNLGRPYYLLGDFQQALDCIHFCLGEQDPENTFRLVEIYNFLGNVHWGRGDHGPALGCYRQALGLLPADAPFSWQFQLLRGQLLNNLGGFYLLWGQLDAALGYYQEAADHLRQVPGQSDYIAYLSNLGGVHLRLGDLDSAWECYDKARELSSAAEDMPFLAPSIFGLGIVSRELDRYAEAKDLLAEALASFRKARETLNVAATLDELGRLHLVSGQGQEAMPVLLEALETKERLGSRYGIAATLALLGSAQEQQGQLDAAQGAFARAVEEFEAAGSQVADATQVGALQESLPRLYAQYARVLVRQGRPEAALLMVERGRAQGLSRQRVSDPARFLAAFPPQEQERLRRAAQEARAASRLLRAIQQQPEPLASADHSDYRQQLEDAIRRSQAAELDYKLLGDTLASRSPALAQQTLPRLAGGQLRALARRNPDALYLSWAVVDEEDTLLFAISHATGIRPVLLPLGHRKLVALVGAWREALTALAETRVDKKAEALALARTEPERATEISSALLSAPELAELFSHNFGRLVIVPDDALLEIPFAALMGADGKRLVKRYAVSASPSLSLLARRRRAHKSRGSLLCVADPLGPAASAPGTRLPEETAKERAEEKAGLTVRTPEDLEMALRRSRSGLEAAREEGKRIAALFPGSKTLVGPDADEATVRHLMPGYALLHFATHGVLNPRSGLRSALILAPQQETLERETLKQETFGMLEARDIMDLRLCAELAVLSACESGLGQRIVGEGVLGFAWAFHAAGCASVVTSLWQVRDRSTAHLMEQFYAALAAEQPKDVALQRAMTDMMEAERYGHPYYWAAFQLIGDATPVSIQASRHPSKADDGA